MATKEANRKQLSERWSDIEQQDEEDAPSSTHPIRRRRLRQLKEQWFSDAFGFLIHLPKENHVWCGYWDLMGPLLETFFNYFKDERSGSPLKLLWGRITEEMKCCTLCIHQHHQAQEMYGTEYEKSCVNPLLDVLRILDEERVTQHLKGLNARIVRGEYDPGNDYGEVVSILFEVLMYPILLDDQSLSTEFQIFIEAIDDSHELKLDGNQQYPGVYALLFLKSRRVRSIGLRLAGRMGKLRKSTDLDPLQHLLKKCIYILETENAESSIEMSRPRVQLDRITVWLGMKALIGFLEPAAFEEGILDRYPIFLSIVLNNISDDSLECSHAINCMRLLFEKLGCKLWLRATLSPSVMRNTLLDGEHEKQRRHFLYFLLHQVPVSSNFSILMKKKASQIAVLIVLRGYSMDPPSSPAECAHMWGPSIVSSLKDLSLHSSLRQPAIDLIQAVVVSDASAFLSLIMNGQFHSGDTLVVRNYCEDDGEEGVLSALDINEGDAGCWKEFTLQHKIISQVDGSWMCAPMLWFDVLAEIDPSFLPLSFSKAIFLALSRFSLIEPENSTVMTLSLKNWLANCASEISYLFGWKLPSGCDDGGDGTESKNSIRISTMCIPLLRTFKRLMIHYTVRMEQGQVRKQWTWEPMMSDSLILLLIDPNDSARQVARLILEQVSDLRGLTSGLQFLCSTSLSLSALLLGLRHALKLVQLDIVLLNFHTLHHLFFILSKLLKEGISSVQTSSQKLSAVSDVSKLSMQGGFLKQSFLDSSTTDCDEYPPILGPTLWKKFTCLLSQAAWPAILKCLDGGKTFIDHTASQMTCIRLLEIIPVVFERLPRNYWTTVETLDNLKWLHDLVDWGKSSLAVLVRYWKQTLASLLGLIKASCSSKSASIINDVEKLISYEKISTDEVSKEVAFLSVALLDDCCSMKGTGLKSAYSISEDSLNRRIYSVEDSENLIFDDAKASVLDSEALIKQARGHTIILSDDEELEISETHRKSSESRTHDDFVGSSASGRVQCSDLKEHSFSNHDCPMGSPKTYHHPSSHTINVSTETMSLEPMGGRQLPASPAKLEPSDSKTKGNKISNSSLPKNNLNLKNSSDAFTNSKQFDSDTSKICSNDKGFSDLSSSASKVQKGSKNCLKTSEEVIKQVVCDTDDDTWQFSFFNPSKRQQTLTTKSSTSGPKRQVIQLAFPMENKSGFKRPGVEVKRFNLPRLDDWYRPILRSDFFVDVGLTSGSDADCKNNSILKKIPVCFQSPDEYVDIFRPLVLEELKAQVQNSFQEMSSVEEMRCGSLSVLSVERIDDFHVVRFVHDETDSTGSKTLLENDLILLTKQPLQTSPGDVHAIGKVERRDKESKRRLNIIAIRLYMQGCPRLNKARKLLTERSKWCVSRIMNITPQLREFQALSSIREIPLFPVILNPVNQPCCQYESRTGNFSKLSQPMQEIIKSSYNGSQLKAISVAIGPFDKDFELSLIQGPPGTGKTRTIVAIISGLLAFSQVKDAKRLRNYDNVCLSSSSTNQRISQSAAIARSWQDAALARQLNEEAEKKKKIMRNCSRGRILICAQSNAAVDELVARISCEGLYGHDGLMYKPYLVRVGNAKTVHPNSLPFFLDTLIENRLKEEKGNKIDEKQSGTTTDSLLITRANLEKLVDKIRYYEAKRASLQEGHPDSKNQVEGGYPDTVELPEAELKEKLRKLYEKKKTLYADLANIQARERKASDEIRTLRQKFRAAILKEAEIVVTTLSGSGGDLYGVCSESISGQNFNSSHESSLFDAVVIDEAAQALEPATLIPLQLLKSRGTKCIMVGDPKQLPATVISTVANKYLFQCSMFERLQRAGHPVIMLTQQYRMHPEICRFPSSHFYEGKLLNGEQMFGKAASFHETSCLGPYMLFDIIDGRETRGKSAAALSIYNECESDAAVEVLRYFKKRYPSEFLTRKIGVITPYKCQLSLLRSRFSSAFGSSVTAEIEFNTVDGFQGREVDILLLSTVRAGGSSSETTRIGSSNLGFVADVRRMNVALTRAKLSLWIFGNARTLQTNPSWAALVEDATQRNLIVLGRKPYSSMFRSTLETRSKSNLTSISGQLEQVERSKAVSGCMNSKKIVKHSAERKRKYDDTVSDNTRATGEDVSHASKDAAKNKKNRVIDETNVPLEKVAAAVAVKDRGNEVLKDANSIEEENQEMTGKTSDKQINEAKARDSNNVRSRFTNSGKAISRSQKQRQSASDGMREETIRHDKRKQKVKAGTLHSEISFKEQDEKGASDQVELLTDSLTKRKQQRAAVDALLSSALVSSKKSDPMRKEHSKRTTSTSKYNPIRPPKTKEG
ncbi:hypothetical protein F511_04575 [Dorcoceras hygrometricum]|uniref:Uncharacterized protein n=1 Tax=Dorcoceras hygrometricum TaxID=472368 RepID=A0A2Z7B193_9LAMI|nr:hypothetical protein F511_04575 [Dorcoceras hygrometricum]